MTERARLRGLLLLAHGLSLGLAGCSAEADRSQTTGAVGVFYGGEVQELERLTVTPARPKTLGFRLEFADAASGPRQVTWKVVRPGPAGRRVAETGAAAVPGDRRRVDQVLELPVPTPPGTYDVRVVVDGVLAIDRAILLVSGD
jgi:hypothetical protein